MFDFLNFREHPRPMSSYTGATNLLNGRQRPAQRKIGALAKFNLCSLERCRTGPPAGIARDPLSGDQKPSLDPTFGRGSLIGGNRLAQEKSR